MTLKTIFTSMITLAVISGTSSISLAHMTWAQTRAAKAAALAVKKIPVPDPKPTLAPSPIPKPTIENVKPATTQVDEKTTEIKPAPQQEKFVAQNNPAPNLVEQMPLPQKALLPTAGEKKTAPILINDKNESKPNEHRDDGVVSLNEFDNLDPHHYIPDLPLKQALTYYKINEDKFPNKNYLVIVDFTQLASADRMYIINLKTGAVEKHMTTVGKGSDPKHTGLAKTFSNNPNSHATSLGFYRTAEVYQGQHGTSLRLDGLSPTNSNARERKIVVHAARYVNENRDVVGRSEGCLALDPNVLRPVIAKIKNGALIYAWAGK